MRAFIALLGLFSPVLFLPQLRADSATLVLTNGDRITGEIRGETPSEVTLDSVLGPLKIPVAKIFRREPSVGATFPGAAGSTNLSMRVAATTNSIPGGANTTSNPAAMGTLSPESAPPIASVPQSGTHGLYLRSPDWMKPMLTNWHGNVQLGLDLGFGTSERRTFYANATANHTWDRVRNLVEYHIAYGVVNQVQSANKMNGSIKTDVDLGKKRRVYVYNQLSAGYDDIRHINSEVDAGAGVGYKFIEKPKLKLSGEVGGQYQNFDYSNSPGKSFFAARIGESLTWKVWDKATITQRFSYSPNVGDPSDYRLRFDMSAGYPLFKKVTINLNVIDQYESNPAPNVHNNDLEIQSTLGFNF